MDTKEWTEVKVIISSLLISNPLEATIRSLNNDFRNHIGYYIPYQKFGFRTLEQCLDHMSDILQRDGSRISVCVRDKSAHINKLVQQQMIPSNKKTRSARTHRVVQRRHTLNNYENSSSQLKNISYTYTPRVHVITTVSTPDTKVNTTQSKTEQHPIGLKTTKDEPSQLKSTSNATPQTNSNVRLIVNSRVPLDVQRNLIMLINKYDSGIWCGELPEKYRALYKKELEYTKYGYKNLILMCMELENIFDCYRPHKADFILYDRTKPIPNDFETRLEQPTEHKIKPVEVKPVTSTTPKALNLLNVVCNSIDVPRQFTICDIKKDDVIKVAVADIYNPGKFYVILSKCHKELYQLMEAMQAFYSKQAEEFRMPLDAISENVLCVVLYNNQYHRAKIIKANTDRKCELMIFCFDYGSMEIVQSSGLYYLHKQFCDLPQQAIEAQLAGIKPLSLKEQWSKEVSLKFLELARDKELFAQIVDVNLMRQQLDVYLVDNVKGDNNVRINDLLVKQGYALFKHQHHAK